MIAFWDRSVGTTLGGAGYPRIRLAGEMPAALQGDSERTDFFRSESALLDLLRTHPKLLLGGLVLENPHYIPPDEYSV
jgi:hypothetical protein